eukprot:GHUV01032480.1.p1 GENE.GHUV01032480.1~~GHUV01032480.1.p1  ORF type:complete len:482 (+),score=92.88 GHUV01032480.1:534-1979(+)
MQNTQLCAQTMGLRALPRLLMHTPVVSSHSRSCHVCAVSSLAQPVLERPSDTVKPLFSSRAKIAEACPPWLKQSRSRSNVEKNFHIEDLYDSDVSSVHIATHRSNQEKTVIKMFKRPKLENRVDLQNKVWRLMLCVWHGLPMQLGLYSSESPGLSAAAGSLVPRTAGALAEILSVLTARHGYVCAATSQQHTADAGQQVFLLAVKNGEQLQNISESNMTLKGRQPCTGVVHLVTTYRACLCVQAQVKQEWEVHSSLSHPNIIKSYLALEDADGVKLFMEYAGESDAYSFITNKQRLCLREADACQLVYDVLTALRYMHSQGIVHRDVKSENVFRAGRVWKLGDFGSCLRIGDKRVFDKQVTKLEGTFSFAAPEYVAIWSAFNRAQLIEATSYKLDSWSVGALAYDVLCGRAPFAEHEIVTRDEEKKAILYKEPDYPSGLSYNAVSFMMQALEKNRQKRPTVAQLQAHPWFDILQTDRHAEQ